MAFIVSGFLVIAFIAIVFIVFIDNDIIVFIVFAIGHWYYCW